MEALARSGQLRAYEHGGFWQPMDTLREKATAGRSLEAGRGAMEDLLTLNEAERARIIEVANEPRFAGTEPSSEVRGTGYASTSGAGLRG
jgi:NDP-sugar pyrophosphorylase family protein